MMSPMTRGQASRLTSIRSALLQELAGNDARLHFINTRLILTVGVDLSDIRGIDDDDANKVELTVSTLHKMGFLKDWGSNG